MAFDIVTFGSAVVDTFIDTEFNKKTGSFSYPAGAKILVEDLKSDIGGGATNVAVAFARFGFNTGCICKVGEDNDGKEIIDLLKKEKVKFLGSISKERTGHSIILDSKGEDRTILTYKGPGNNIDLDELPKFETKWLYYSSMIGKTFKTQEVLAKKLVKDGIKLVFNPSDYLIKKMNILPLLKMTYVLVLNKEEAEMLCKRYNLKGDILDCLREFGPKIVVVTNKDKLTYAYDGIKKYSIKPHNIKVVERTGAGDAFAAGFTAGLMVNKSLQQCLELGLKESESVLRYFGAKNNLLRMKLK
ncbi:MAG TPA: carbohydrate kinase family protein [Nanoarchaeota archaeon]|nr:carbohydrate kinase family protein [Nanoarchaeota archaeon]HIH63447.1 carbohydrate kinase family protein [Nanoarchaeota archaeon]HIJ09377.1 carbohydrate kinase family protein [Nanoarchaeota archaeon]